MTDADTLVSRFLALPIDGVSISVRSAAGAHSTVAVSNDDAARLERLHFDLGEGPHWWALRTGEVTTIPDAARTDHSRWPVFGNALPTLGIGAVFSIPMTVGAATVGVVDLHRLGPGELSATALWEASMSARAVIVDALRSATAEASVERATADDGHLTGSRREVHQATGMLSVQLGVGMSEAFAQLRAMAYASGRNVDDVARDIVQRRLDLRSD